MSGTDPDPRQGEVFADAQYSIQAGPLILNPDGQLIWFDPLPNRGFVHDAAVQRYQGNTVLTFWRSSWGGAAVILDHHYRQVAVVRAGNGLETGDHEFQITPQGTALIIANAHVPADLRALGGPRRGTVADDVLQEIDIPSGQVLWEWDAFHHVGLTASYEGTPGSGLYDYLHTNSIQQLPNGNLLVSVRNTWAVYEISRRTGRILWTLGGKHSSFKMGPGTNFEWQHDARMQPDGTITLFDDGSDGVTANESESRALRIRLNFKAHTATLVHAYISRPPVLAVDQGNMQVLPDGNTFVASGFEAYFTEFSKRGGAQLFSLHFNSPLETYRGYRFQWWGQPTGWPPSIAAAATAAGTTVYASWNGATDVASWRVLGGATGDPTAMTPVGQFPKTSFETQMWVRNGDAYFAVQALGEGGQVLGTSAAVAR